ncbi:MAG: YicC/YloC family endoribonuclease [Candidatus Ozemobacteraceae bacterium]
MVTSLTGFGRAEHTDDIGRIAVELKSVNNRYLQLDLHLPYGQGWADVPLRTLLSERLTRGKITVNVEIVEYSPTTEVIVNRPLLKQLLTMRAELEGEIGQKISMNLDGLLGLPGIMKIGGDPNAHEAAWERLRPVVEAALKAFVEGRRREGANLAADMKARRQRLIELTDMFEKRLPEYKALFQERFSIRIRELAQQASLDEGKLATEIALWADRIDITEEITRLKSHLDELGKILERTDPVGRRLDFLLQEINREANTINSKIGDLTILQGGLEVKCEVEKIREQAQNIE